VAIAPSRNALTELVHVRSGRLFTLGAGEGMRLLKFLVSGFVNVFGITAPKPEQERMVALVLGGFLLLTGITLSSVLVWMIFGQHR
jgi:hypothetical protein